MRNKSYDITERLIVSIQEGSINEESRTADIVAIQSGWSYNGNYYTKEVAESLSNLLLQRRKIFANHTDDKKFGREIQDWVATVVESYGKDGKTYAKIKFCKDDLSNKIFEAALDFPDEVQFSIDALARVHEGEAEGRKGTIVDKIARLNSLDVVDYASAGGQLQRAYASRMESELSILKEAADALKDRVAKRYEKSRLSALFDVFMNMLYELSWSYEEEDDKSKEREN